MAAKELLLVLAGTATLGGVGGATLAIFSRADQPAPAADVSAELIARLDRIEKNQHRATKRVDKMRGDMNSLSEDVAATRIDVNRATEQLVAAGSTATATGPWNRFADVHVEMDDGSGQKKLLPRVFHMGPGGGQVDLDKGLTDLIAGSLDNIEMDFEGTHGEAMRAAMKSAMKGFRLRSLPESERWAKAQEELSLTDNQVDDLKRATSDLDAAMKDAMVEDRRVSDNGATFVSRRLDREKAKTAREDYARRVDNTLDSEQKDKWSKNGYDNAFGRSGGPRVAIMSVTTTQEFTEVKTDNSGEDK